MSLGLRSRVVFEGKRVVGIHITYSCDGCGKDSLREAPAEGINGGGEVIPNIPHGWAREHRRRGYGLADGGIKLVSQSFVICPDCLEHNQLHYVDSAVAKSKLVQVVAAIENHGGSPVWALKEAILDIIDIDNIVGLGVAMAAAERAAAEGKAGA